MKQAEEFPKITGTGKVSRYVAKYPDGKGVVYFKSKFSDGTEELVPFPCNIDHPYVGQIVSNTNSEIIGSLIKPQDEL